MKSGYETPFGIFAFVLPTKNPAQPNMRGFQIAKYEKRAASGLG
jgi:hypothetical protein